MPLSHGAGFERWNKIYGETDEVNKVQLDIRTGHAQTVDKVVNWLDSDGGVKGVSVCDCGCGTGSLAIPLALRGAAVTASDISGNMVKEAERRYNEQVSNGASAPETAPVWEAKDLESASGKYDVVACLDVMIHYPQVCDSVCLGSCSDRPVAHALQHKNNEESAHIYVCSDACQGRVVHNAATVLQRCSKHVV